MESHAQYTIRGVDSGVDATLRRVAREHQMSLNGYLVSALQKIAKEANEPVIHHDLDFAIGSMTDGDLVDQTLREFSVMEDAHGQ